MLGLEIPLYRTWRRDFLTGVLVVSGLGLVAAVYLGYVELDVIHALCPVCFSTYVADTIVFLLSLWLFWSSRGAASGDEASLAKPDEASESPTTRLRRGPGLALRDERPLRLGAAPLVFGADQLVRACNLLDRGVERVEVVAPDPTSIRSSAICVNTREPMQPIETATPAPWLRVGTTAHIGRPFIGTGPSTVSMASIADFGRAKNRTLVGGIGSDPSGP